MMRARLWVGGTLVTAVLISIGAWFLLISPQRTQAAELRTQTEAQLQKNQQIKAETARLAEQNRTLPERKLELARIQEQFPNAPQLPALVRVLNDHAVKAGVELKSLSPSAPTPVSSGTTGATDAASGLSAVATNLTVIGSYAQLTLFVQDLQTKTKRAFLIENMNFTVGGDEKKTEPEVGVSPTLQLTITGKVFVLDTAAVSAPTPGQTPAAPNQAS